MKCANCKHWQTKPTTGSTRGDEGMAANGYKGCAKDTSAFAYGYFFHSTSKACEKYEVKK